MHAKPWTIVSSPYTSRMWKGEGKTASFVPSTTSELEEMSIAKAEGGRLGMFKMTTNVIFVKFIQLCHILTLTYVLVSTITKFY
jgi:hypothetical protein